MEKTQIPRKHAGKKVSEEQEQCADQEADQMESRMEHQLHDYMEAQE